jgi:uncharacterized protein YjbI with pentapeptide repeats
VERAELTKRRLEIEKLTLEKRALERQLSLYGLLMQWLQAFGVPVTLLGAILVFFVGYNQLHQTAETREADRFDRTLTRLSSERPDNRMSGVSGLELFLRDSHSAFQKATLQFLINALSVEKNSQVQGAILDMISEIDPKNVDSATLNSALRTAVERNRSLASSITAAWHSRMERDKKGKIKAFAIPDVDVASLGESVPAAIIAKLTLEQYLALLDVERGPFDDLPADQVMPLQGLVGAINRLIALGATGLDFKGIYCARCDFTPAKNMNSAIFDGAFLANADFAHVKLERASFYGADVSRASFFAADLTDADFRAYDFWSSTSFPTLECAKLIGADLSGLPLAEIEEYFSTVWEGEHAREIVVPGLMSAVIDGTTKMTSFTVLVTESVSDAYVNKHPNSKLATRLTANRDFLMIDDPLRMGRSMTSKIRRNHADYITDAALYTDTSFRIASNVDLETITGKHLGDGALLLQYYLKQPSLQSIPLIAKFNAAVDARVVPVTTSDNPLKNYKAPDCSSVKKAPMSGFRIDSGRRSVSTNGKGSPPIGDFQ